MVVIRVRPPIKDQFKVEINEKTTVLELINNGIFPKEKTGIKPSQLRLYVTVVTENEDSDNKEPKKNKVYLKLHKPIPEDVTEIFCKDIGVQISYRNVFIAEYLGPFVIWLLMYFFNNYEKPDLFKENKKIMLYSLMWLGHYGKRLYETFFVHVFSQPTMPIKNLFKNCTYYWMNTVTIATELMIYKDYTGDKKNLDIIDLFAFIGFVFCECVNFYAHVALKNMRPPGSYEHVLPKGFLFTYIACPNYTFELLSWIFYSIGSRSIMCFAFFLQGLYQIWQWAGKKMTSLQREFGKECKVVGRLLPIKGF